ncbi:glycosyltransferase family 4 protein [Robertkochia aurantiaca]|uniref:glycosyltransferase family 4 protein n=1 Tax=Robertkochia aurantiaca TaxID=2873700 RepID=UPI001CCF6275|nr:glycosyltransferase family 4 protein [Robertkochia sp. 3YJGBD-33]
MNPQNKDAKKTVVIVTYYWPPAGGPGVQRWLRFVSHLPDHGIKPVVIIPENPTYPITDPRFLKEVPEAAEIHRVPIREPYKWAKLFSFKKTQKISRGIIEDKRQSMTEKFLLWVRGNFFVPDARVSWVEPVSGFLENYLGNHHVDALITTGPPHSLHLIGMALKERTGMYWMADFRDPWTSIGYHEKLFLGNKARKQHESLERKVLNLADRIIATSYSTRRELQEKTSKPVSMITNGYEPEEVQVSLTRDFTLRHIGSLLSGRNPKNLWRVLKELSGEMKGFRESLKIELAGVVSDEVVDTIKSFGLEENLVLLGYVEHREALKLQHAAQVLLLLEIDSDITRGIIPGKIFEYMASGRPILAIGPTSWDAGRLLREAEYGQAYAYEDYQLLKSKIREYFISYKEGNLKGPDADIAAYSRSALTRKLAALIP